MHSIKNISERNKIVTQSRADEYIRRKRLIGMSDYNLKSESTQKYSWNWKNPKTLSSGQIYKENPIKPNKTQQNPKKPKNTLRWFSYFKIPGFFPTLPGAAPPRTPAWCQRTPSPRECHERRSWCSAQSRSIWGKTFPTTLRRRRRCRVSCWKRIVRTGKNATITDAAASPAIFTKVIAESFHML